MDERELELDDGLEVKPDPIMLEPLKLEERAFGGGGVRLEVSQSVFSVYPRVSLFNNMRSLPTTVIFLPNY
jgi:hypothetical protein